MMYPLIVEDTQNIHKNSAVTVRYGQICAEFSTMRISVQVNYVGILCRIYRIVGNPGKRKPSDWRVRQGAGCHRPFHPSVLPTFVAGLN